MEQVRGRSKSEDTSVPGTVLGRYCEVDNRKTGGTNTSSGLPQSHMGLASTQHHTISSILWNLTRLLGFCPCRSRHPMSSALSHTVSLSSLTWSGNLKTRNWAREMLVHDTRWYRACLFPRILTVRLSTSKAHSVGQKGNWKKKSKIWETKKWLALQSLQQWVYFYNCHMGQRV